jgi:hypothetical protein
MKGASHRCIECDEIITNPVCSDCLAKRIRVMIQELRPGLARGIKGFKTEGDTPCIFCGNLMALCAHCFSEGIYDYLSEKDAMVAKEFLNRFDFDLRKSLVDFS